MVNWIIYERVLIVLISMGLIGIFRGLYLINKKNQAVKMDFLRNKEEIIDVTKKQK